ncbi:uncharacterized protein PAC_04258 [Phialocephala subalpina]|uniref:Uncharacterized protein n=1 Tax=Phialocephala subalpina TaxID=576137 RepID=A0A1L7WNN2_9HELO|nr:uncharacterized protein PAC_04258 [Phialocephala subalpina]
MSDLYRSGRGGAGNFHSRPSLDEASKDIEAQHESSLNLTRTTSATKPPPEYLHTGRGGAGNWVQPSELSSQGLAQTQDSSLAFSQPGASKPSYKGGRGGAGNYGWAEAEEEERKKREREGEREEERRKREVERAVMRDVEVGLARPERAFGGAYEMRDNGRGQDRQK